MKIKIKNINDLYNYFCTYLPDEKYFKRLYELQVSDTYDEFLTNDGGEDVINIIKASDDASDIAYRLCNAIGTTYAKESKGFLKLVKLAIFVMYGVSNGNIIEPITCILSRACSVIYSTQYYGTTTYARVERAAITKAYKDEEYLNRISKDDIRNFVNKNKKILLNIYSNHDKFNVRSTASYFNNSGLHDCVLSGFNKVELLKFNKSVRDIISKYESSYIIPKMENMSEIKSYISGNKLRLTKESAGNITEDDYKKYCKMTLISRYKDKRVINLQDFARDLDMIKSTYRQCFKKSIDVLAFISDLDVLKFYNAAVLMKLKPEFEYLFE